MENTHPTEVHRIKFIGEEALGSPKGPGIFHYDPNSNRVSEQYNGTRIARIDGSLIVGADESLEGAVHRVINTSWRSQQAFMNSEDRTTGAVSMPQGLPSSDFDAYELLASTSIHPRKCSVTLDLYRAD